MLIGIDVGGTYTDGVVFDGGHIHCSVKVPTDDNNLLQTLMQVLDELLKSLQNIDQISRVVLSTTLVTNILASGRGERTALVLIPGFGLPHNAYQITADTFFLSGAIDFRGRETEALHEDEIIALAQQLKEHNFKRVAVVGKFSNRNNSQELKVKDVFQQIMPEVQVFTGSQVSNQLNFPRRAVTTFYTAMILPEWMSFAGQIEEALKSRGLQSEIHILKADGGTMPLHKSLERPCETVFSGPAASTMGALAITMDAKNSVVIDIGGSTSDLSLIIDGQPLYASRGAEIEGQLTHVESFSLKSVPLGGDSPIIYNRETGKVDIAASRLGPAACFNGNAATVTDAFNQFYELGLGDSKRSNDFLSEIAAGAQISVKELCDQVINQVFERLEKEIKAMFRQWENEPAYRVWEVVNRSPFRLDRIIGIGAAAGIIVPQLARRLGVESVIHAYSPVANALGAAVVRPTMSVQLHIDTQQGICIVQPGGEVESPGNLNNMQMEDARKLAVKILAEQAGQAGLQEYAQDYSIQMEEQFNLIRSYHTSGKIFDVAVQIRPGFIHQYKGVKI